MSKILTRSRRKYILLALIILMLSMAGLETWRTYNYASDLKDAAGELQSLAGGDLEKLDLDTVTALVQRARQDAVAIQNRTRLIAPLTNRLGWLPKIGPAIAAGAPLVDYAANLIIAGDELLTGFAPLLQEDTADEISSLSARLLDVLQNAGTNISSAEAALQNAYWAREGFRIEAIPASLRGPIEQVDHFFPLAQQAVRVLRVLPSLLGDNRPHTYLLLAQNEDELRATGGFISGVGTLTVDQGRIVSLTMGDSYSVDDLSKSYPAPPEPLQRYMSASIWLVRDGNWSPDFPTAAYHVRELYRISTAMLPDGVIAFDQQALERVLEVTGPVLLPSTPDPIGAVNIRDYMRQAWAPAPGEGLDREWWEQRKDFMAELGSALVDQVQGSADRRMLLALGRTMMDLVREKHVLIYIDESAAAYALSDLGWDGSLHPVEGDFLMVVDSNVGFNKVDPMIERQIEYQVDMSNPTAPLTATVVLSYSNTVAEDIPCIHEATYGEGTYINMRQRCYWDYVRVFAPEGTLFLGGSLPPVPGNWLISGEGQNGDWSVSEGEGGLAVYGGMFVLPTASQATLRLSYLLPASTVQIDQDLDLTYTLRLVKQPGTSGTPVTVTLLPPQGYALYDSPEWTVLSDGALQWSNRLFTDTEISVNLRSD